MSLMKSVHNSTSNSLSPRCLVYRNTNSSPAVNVAYKGSHNLSEFHRIHSRDFVYLKTILRWGTETGGRGAWLPSGGKKRDNDLIQAITWSRQGHENNISELQC